MNQHAKNTSNGIPTSIEFSSTEDMTQTKYDSGDFKKSLVTNQDIASMKRMIQYIRKNPDLLYTLCDMPAAILQNCPQWASVENPIALRRSFQKDSEEYYCQECDSPSSAKSQMPVIIYEISEYFKSGHSKGNPIQRRG